ncbi:unnamed protein product [Discosporangium mesarthrocarpum]
MAWFDREDLRALRPQVLTPEAMERTAFRRNKAKTSKWSQSVNSCWTKWVDINVKGQFVPGDLLHVGMISSSKRGFPGQAKKGTELTEPCYHELKLLNLGSYFPLLALPLCLLPTQLPQV